MRSNNVVNIEDYKRRSALKANAAQSVANAQQKDAINKRHTDSEIVRRWQLRQSIETISRRMGLGTLYVQAVLRENFVAILPPVDSVVVVKRAA